MLEVFKWIVVSISAVMLTACNGTFSDMDNAEQQSGSATVSIAPKKTGQTISYHDYDDAYYRKGVEPKYSRDNDKEVVLDEIRGLIWQDDVSAKLVHKQWDQTRDYCSDLTVGGYRDWRMPTSKELEDLVDYGRNTPAIDPVFSNTALGFYWTSDHKSNGDAWAVSFEDGSVVMRLQGFAFYIRCVRGR